MTPLRVRSTVSLGLKLTSCGSPALGDGDGDGDGDGELDDLQIVCYSLMPLSFW